MQKCPRDPTTYPRRMPKHPHKRWIHCEKRRCIWHRKNRARKLNTLCKPYTITKCYSLFQRWDPCDQRRAHTELNWTELCRWRRSGNVTRSSAWLIFKITNHNQHDFNIKYLANLIKKYWTCFRYQKLADFLVCFPPSVRMQVRSGSGSGSGS